MLWINASCPASKVLSQTVKPSKPTFIIPKNSSLSSSSATTVYIPQAMPNYGHEMPTPSSLPSLPREDHEMPTDEHGIANPSSQRIFASQTHHPIIGAGTTPLSAAFISDATASGGIYLMLLLLNKGKFTRKSSGPT